MTSNHQHVLALIEIAVTNALIDIREDSESLGLTAREAVDLITKEVLTDKNSSLEDCILQGLNEYVLMDRGAL